MHTLKRPLAVLACAFLASSPAFAQTAPTPVPFDVTPSPSISPGEVTEYSGPANTGATGGAGQSKAYPYRISVDKVIESFKFDDNRTENGFLNIPPDPSGAAGKSRLAAVVNSMIEVRTKGGALVFRDGLRDFFAPLSPASSPFDPKIVYDPHQGRFLVVALLQQTGTASQSPGNVSRILLAVSKGENPASSTAADWNYFAIDSKQTIFGAFDGWADYPGFEVDEEAVYVTANIFTFVPFGFFGGVRLWIVPKDGFYDGSSATANVYDPYAGGGVATTTMPAEIRQAGGAGPGVGTYLVSYSGLSIQATGEDFIQVVRVNDPLGSPTFVGEFISIGDIDNNNVGLPNAPQAGSPYLINTNDRRALDAVWQNDALWLVATGNPNSGSEIGQATAHFWKVDTSAVDDASAPADLLVLDQQGDITGEDIAPGTFTFFPSVAVNKYGAAAFGFSASAPSIYAGAYATGRGPSDPAGTVRASETVHEGLAPYKRFFGGTRNRWGDYSGISVDPTNDKNVWFFNEYADTPGTPTNGSQGAEDGRWANAYARGKFLGSPN